jgi:hypothetical protein
MSEQEDAAGEESKRSQFSSFMYFLVQPSTKILLTVAQEGELAEE